MNLSCDRIMSSMIRIYFQMPILNINIVGGHFENYPDGRSRNSMLCTTFSVMVLGIERLFVAFTT